MPGPHKYFGNCVYKHHAVLLTGSSCPGCGLRQDMHHCSQHCGAVNTTMERTRTCGRRIQSNSTASGTLTGSIASMRFLDSAGVLSVPPAAQIPSCTFVRPVDNYTQV
jgi:hypothetical protein